LTPRAAPPPTAPRAADDEAGPLFERPADRPKHAPLALALKRAFDVTVSASALAIGAPALLAIAAAVKLESRGPALYTQTRVGLNGVPFTILKFRSMQIDAESGGVRWATRDDPRATRLGGLLRRSCIDEVPQLWNVLRGDMSLIGPRPERPVFVREFRNTIQDYDLRHTMRPGLSGWSQVNGLRGDVSIGARTQADVDYVRRFSLALDARIFLRTFVIVVTGT